MPATTDTPREGSRNPRRDPGDASDHLDRRSPKTRRAPVIVGSLLSEYGGGVVELDHASPFELLVATILSAQSTDKKVNEITPALFKKYARPEDYLAVAEEELQQDLYQTGFYRQKARSIRGMSQALIDRYGGEGPL